MMAGVVVARRAAGAALAFMAALLGSDAAAQELQGLVLLGEDPVASAPVELHRVTRDSAGVVARGHSDEAGRFGFTLPPADTAGFTVYFATAEHLGVRYFGPALHPAEPLEAYTIVVRDTVSVGRAAVPLRVSRRDLVVLPDRSGAWEINEVLQLRNENDRTLVSSDGMPTWEFRLPPDATAFELGEGEIAASDVVRMGDRVLLLVPLVPGDRDLFLRYRLPDRAGQLRIAFDSPTDSVNVYLRQPSPTVTLDGLTPAENVVVEREEFLAYRGSGFAPGALATLSWVRSGPPIPPVAAAVSVVGVLLAFGAAAAFVRRDRPRPGDPTPHDQAPVAGVAPRPVDPPDAPAS